MAGAANAFRLHLLRHCSRISVLSALFPFYRGTVHPKLASASPSNLSLEPETLIPPSKIPR
eukprot:scaffold33901_cov66-Skeletonema_marinoi.AAC.1